MLVDIRFMSHRDDDLSDWLADLAGAELADAPALDPATVPSPHHVLGASAAGARPAGGEGAPTSDPRAAALDEPARGPGAEKATRPRRLWLMAAVPWMLIALVGAAAWAGITDTGGDHAAGGDAAGGDHAAGGDQSGMATSVGPQGAGHAADRRGGGRSAAPVADAAAVPPRLAALAEMAVATTGAGHLATAEGAAVHVDHARAVAVTALGDGALVTVAALVRRADDGRWAPPHPARFAAVLDGDGQLREPPWLLIAGASPAEPSAPAGLDAIDLDAEPELAEAAVAALGAAGYADIDLDALQRVDDDLALRAAVRAVPPGGTARGPHVAWLSPDAGSVLGHHDRRDDDS